MKTDMSPRHGWGPKGRRVHGSAPFGHRGTFTFMAALRQDRIDAPWVLDGPADGDAFRAYVETQLVPTPDRGDIVVMDNPGSRHASHAELERMALDRTDRMAALGSAWRRPGSTRAQAPS